jgi:Ca2+-binding RTX toxin-like protein
MQNKTLKVSYVAGTNSSASKYLGYFKAGDVVTVTTQFRAQSNVSGAVFLGDAGGDHPYNNCVDSGPVYGNGEWQTITKTLTMKGDDHVWVYVYGDRDGAYHVAGNTVEYDNLMVSSLQRGVVLDDRMDNVTQGVDYFSTANWCVGGRIDQLTGVYSSVNQNNVLVSGSSNDRLVGGVGNDTYVFNRGGGQDVIYDLDSTIGNTDVLSFGTGIAADQLWFKHVNNDLEISVIGSFDKTTIQNWYLGSQNQIEQIKVTDKMMLNTDVEKLVQAMAAFSVPASGQSVLPSNYQTTLAPVISANWN